MWLLGLLIVWAVALRGVYATEELNVQRFWDEKYSIPNLHAVLEQGSWRPADYAYLRLSYLPQVAALGAVQLVARQFDPEFSWFAPPKRPGDQPVLLPRGFLAVRWVQAVIGGLTLWLTFVLGRRLFSASAGLLGALLVAASPYHLLSSTIFKPDILLLALTLVSFLWSLEAVRRPGLGRYLLAGLGIGMVLSTKLTGGPIAVPLAAAALWRGRKDRRHWLGLVAAGATSVALLVALNPYLRHLSAFALQRQFYREAAARNQTLADPLAAYRQLIGGMFAGHHGLLLGLVAVAGFAWLAYRSWRDRRDEDRALPWAMLVIFPVAFCLIYGLATQAVLGQNLLPLLPFTSLAAAVLLVAVWRRAARRFTALGSRPATALAAALLALLATFDLHGHFYRVMVPTTRELVLRALAAEHSGRARAWVRWESRGEPEKLEPGPPAQTPGNLELWQAAELSELPSEALDTADFEVFERSRTEEPEGGFYRGRMERVAAAERRIFEPRIFHARGPALVVLSHRWTVAGRSRVVELEAKAGYRFAGSADLFALKIDGEQRSVLRDNSRCAEVTLPAGAEIELGYGLNRRRLLRSNVSRYVARFGLVLQAEATAEPRELFRAVLHLRAPGGEVDGHPWRQVTVPLYSWAGQRVRLCVTTEEVGHPDRDTTGLALWDRVAVVDRGGAEHADTFRHWLSAPGGRAGAARLQFRTSVPRPRDDVPRVTAAGREVELVGALTGQSATWTSDRFALPAGRRTRIGIRLPRSVEQTELAVAIQYWTAGGSARAD